MLGASPSLEYVALGKRPSAARCAIPQLTAVVRDHQHPRQLITSERSFPIQTNELAADPGASFIYTTTMWSETWARTSGRSRIALYLNNHASEQWTGHARRGHYLRALPRLSATRL